MNVLDLNLRVNHLYELDHIFSNQWFHFNIKDKRKKSFKIRFIDLKYTLNKPLKKGYYYISRKIEDEIEDVYLELKIPNLRFDRNQEIFFFNVNLDPSRCGNIFTTRCNGIKINHSFNKDFLINLIKYYYENGMAYDFHRLLLLKQYPIFNRRGTNALYVKVSFNIKENNFPKWVNIIRFKWFKMKLLMNSGDYREIVL